MSNPYAKRAYFLAIAPLVFSLLAAYIISDFTGGHFSLYFLLFLGVSFYAFYKLDLVKSPEEDNPNLSEEEQEPSDYEKAVALKEKRIAAQHAQKKKLQQSKSTEKKISTEKPSEENQTTTEDTEDKDTKKQKRIIDPLAPVDGETLPDRMIGKDDFLDTGDD